MARHRSRERAETVDLAVLFGACHRLYASILNAQADHRAEFVNQLSDILSKPIEWLWALYSIRPCGSYFVHHLTT